MMTLMELFILISPQKKEKEGGGKKRLQKRHQGRAGSQRYSLKPGGITDILGIKVFDETLLFHTHSQRPC